MQVRWIKLDRVSSTNAYIAGLLREGEGQEELVVIADYQEAGKGRGSNRWHSEKGRNLLMSVLLFPVFLSASKQYYLSKAVSLAVCDLLRTFRAQPVIKWPNDIMIGRGKVAGILIEHGVVRQTLHHSIVGIGMNLNQTTFPPFRVPATSLVLETGHSVEPPEAARRLHGHFHERLDQLEKGAVKELDCAYLELLYGMHRTCSFTSGDRSFHGVIRGVNEFGELLVEEEGVTRAYGFQEISFSAC